MLERMMMAMRLAGLVFGLMLLASTTAWGQSGVREIQVVVPAQGIVTGSSGFQVSVSAGNAGIYYGSGYPVGYGYPGYYPAYGNGYPVYGGSPAYNYGCGYPPAGYSYPTFGGYQVNPNGTSTQLSPGLILFPAAPTANPVLVPQRPICNPYPPPICAPRPTRLYRR